MSWHVEYFEREDARQPAEEFEDDLQRSRPRLYGKLLDNLVQLEEMGPLSGGGRAEKCHDYPGLWESRALFNNLLAREFFGFDGTSIVLVHGYIKAVGKRESRLDFKKAHRYWLEYLAWHRISPEVEGKNE